MEKYKIHYIFIIFILFYNIYIVKKINKLVKEEKEKIDYFENSEIKNYKWMYKILIIIPPIILIIEKNIFILSLEIFTIVVNIYLIIEFLHNKAEIIKSYEIKTKSDYYYTWLTNHAMEQFYWDSRYQNTIKVTNKQTLKFFYVYFNSTDNMFRKKVKIERNQLRKQFYVEIKKTYKGYISYKDKIKNIWSEI